MTKTTEEQTSDLGSKRPRSKQGVPRIDLARAEEAAKALWEAARTGSTSESAFAKQLIGPSGKASGGAWKTRLGSMKYFGVLESSGPSQLTLTEIGRRIVRVTEPEVVAAARKDAVLSVTPYREILQKSEGHELPATPGIVGTFQFDYGLSEPDAKKAAENFESSVKAAGLLDANGKVSLAGGGYVPPGEPSADDEVDDGVDETIEQDASIDTDEVLDEADVPPADPAGDGVVDPATGSDKAARQREPRKVTAAKNERPPTPAPKGNATQDGTALATEAPDGVSIRIKMDMTRWQADDVVKVLNALSGLTSR